MAEGGRRFKWWGFSTYLWSLRGGVRWGESETGNREAKRVCECVGGRWGMWGWGGDRVFGLPVAHLLHMGWQGA